MAAYARAWWRGRQNGTTPDLGSSGVEERDKCMRTPWRRRENIQRVSRMGRTNLVHVQVTTYFETRVISFFLGLTLTRKTIQRSALDVYSIPLSTSVMYSTLLHNTTWEPAVHSPLEGGIYGVLELVYWFLADRRSRNRFCEALLQRYVQ